VPGAAGTWKDLVDNLNQLAGTLTTQVRAIAEVATAVTKGDLTRSIKVEAQGEVAALKDNINEMIRNLKDTTLKNSEQDWLKTNLAKFSRMLQGQRDMLTVGRLILSELAPVVSAQHAVFYTLDTTDTPQLRLLASYAYQKPNAVGQTLALGEGLVGQCALDKQKIVLMSVPPDFIRISSGLGEAAPVNIIVLPILFEGQVKAVMELASFNQFNPTHQALLDQLTESIGIVLNTIEANTRTEDLLKQSQSLAQELQSRQEELQQTNQELQEKARLLAHQNAEVERKNREVEQARQALEEKAKQLALTSKYKSEFLANMSHELRTPLNSLLILSDQLSKNPDGNLTSKQTEFAKTIHSSGNDLLTLINDILDLSKIESGTVVVDVSELRFGDLGNYVERTFSHVAEAKGLGFNVELDPHLPKSMLTDAKRLQQIIKNLLANAFKFTRTGHVSLRVEPVAAGWNSTNDTLNGATGVISMSVRDTGIGIAPDKQQIIFEAFQQADGSTSRKFGGTGLGLAISREIARLLGGEIRLQSAVGEGSTFTLYVPQAYSPPRPIRKSVAAPVEATALAPLLPMPVSDVPLDLPPEDLINEVGDDRDKIQPGDRVLLIVDNDIGFSRFLLETARDRGFKGLVTSMGATGLAMAREYKPDAVTLDICLPDINGWRVLDRLKNDFSTRHIPVFVITTEEETEHGLRLGAVGVLRKPIQTKEVLDQAIDSIKEFVDRPTRHMLILEPDKKRRAQIKQMVAGDDIRVTAVASAKEAQAAFMDNVIDCVVSPPQAPDALLCELAENFASNGSLIAVPWIVYGDGEFTGAVAEDLKRLSQRVIVKEVHSAERLFDQASLFLHRDLEKIDPEQREVLDRLHDPAHVLTGKKVLIVDDDIRNIFALTSVLERQNMMIYPAETGRAAIETLKSTPDIDIVLMDIMMPEMDGLDTMQAIRKIPAFKNLPIVAVTAKAMKGDREKCIEAGAWDYLAKPVDTEQMLSVMKAWLHR
jgi:signal transduction histidine kinase/DNA-binding response OmpR family regulator/HAMP domain-containing protein